MKIRKLFILLLLAVLFLTGCGKEQGNSENESLNIPNSISFSQLKELAGEPAYSPRKNYTISGEMFDIDSNASFVQCLGSNLCTVYENSTYVLKNFNTKQEICSDIYRSAVYDAYGQFERYNYVYANSSLPIAIYGVYNSSTAITTIHYVDPYGKSLATETTTNGDMKYLGNVYSKTVGDYNYFYLQPADGFTQNEYFRYKYNGAKYIVESISENDYNNANGTNNPAEYEYLDNLIECYDSNGQVFAYYYSKDNSYFLYDANKHYLNNINISSFGFNSYSASLRLEKKLCFFKNEEYYESQINRGSNATYKCRCLEIDLSTGKVSYNDDFKYYVVSVNNRITNNAYDCCYVIYYDVKDNGELSKLQKCVILHDELSFENAFIYDGFRSAYKVDDNTLLAYFDTGLYLVTPNERTIISGINNITYFEDGSILYSNIDGKYYTCKLSDILETIKSFEGGFTYLSINTYNGKAISYDYDAKTGKYIANGLELNSSYLSYARTGIYVTEKCIYVGNEKIVDGGELTINQISNYASFGDSTIYRVRFTDGSYKYFMYKCVLEK